VQGQRGLLLVANASRQSLRWDAIEEALAISPLEHAIQAFLQSALDIEAAVEELTFTYGTDSIHELRDHLGAVPTQYCAGWREGYESVVMAVKAQEAILKGERVELPPDCFEWIG
jgi:hypothetical protein